MTQTLKFTTKSKLALNNLKSAQILSQAPSANYSKMNATKSMLLNGNMSSLRFGLISNTTKYFSVLNKEMTQTPKRGMMNS